MNTQFWQLNDYNLIEMQKGNDMIINNLEETTRHGRQIV
jgi:hypothetical protein